MNILLVPETNLKNRTSLYLDPESKLSEFLTDIQDSVQNSGINIDRSNYTYVKGKLCKFSINLIPFPDLSLLEKRKEIVSKLTISLDKLKWDFNDQKFFLRIGKIQDYEILINVLFLKEIITEEIKEKINEKINDVISEAKEEMKEMKEEEKKEEMKEEAKVIYPKRSTVSNGYQIPQVNTPSLVRKPSLNVTIQPTVIKPLGENVVIPLQVTTKIQTLQNPSQNPSQNSSQNPPSQKLRIPMFKILR